MVCNDLEGQDGVGCRREAHEGGSICVPVADSCRCMVETKQHCKVNFVVAVQSRNRDQVFVTPCTVACQASLFFTVSRSLLKLMFIELVMPSNHLILGHPLLLRPQSFLASRSFPMSWLFTSGSQSITALASASVFQCIFRVDFL